MKKYLIKLFQQLEAASRKQRISGYIKSGNLLIGEHTYGYHHLEMDVYVESGASKVIFGKYCSIARNVRLITGGIHPVDWTSTYPFRAKWDLPGKYKDGMPYSKGDIVIGNDVWIGAKVTILSGVNIGDGAVIATGATINKDVPPYAMVGGVPAKIIKYRFSKEIIEKLLKIRWWDWEKEEVLKAVPLLSGATADAFVEKYENS